MDILSKVTDEMQGVLTRQHDGRYISGLQTRKQGRLMKVFVTMDLYTRYVLEY